MKHEYLFLLEKMKNGITFCRPLRTALTRTLLASSLLVMSTSCFSAPSDVIQQACTITSVGDSTKQDYANLHLQSVDPKEDEQAVRGIVLGDNDIFVFDKETRVSINITNTDNLHEEGESVSSVGSVAFVRSGSRHKTAQGTIEPLFDLRGGVYITDLLGKTSERVFENTQESIERDLVWSEDGKKLFFVSGKTRVTGSIISYDQEQRELTQITHNPWLDNKWIRRIKPSPDGKYIGYLDDVAVNVVQTDGLYDRKISTANGREANMGRDEDFYWVGDKIVIVNRYKREEVRVDDKLRTADDPLTRYILVDNDGGNGIDITARCKKKVS